MIHTETKKKFWGGTFSLSHEFTDLNKTKIISLKQKNTKKKDQISITTSTTKKKHIRHYLVVVLAMVWGLDRYEFNVINSISLLISNFLTKQREQMQMSFAFFFNWLLKMRVILLFIRILKRCRGWRKRNHKIYTVHTLFSLENSHPFANQDFSVI